jgi:hypothetical protein
MKKRISKKREKKKSKRPEEKKEIKIEEIVKKAEKEIERKKSEQPEFEQFPEEWEFETGSPSLGKINASPRSVISLEEDLSQTTPAPVKKDEEDSFKYSFKGETSGEPKYQHYESESVSEFFPKTEIESLGRTMPERREIGFTSSAEAKPAETNFEKYTPAKRFEGEKLGRENPLERKEIKYKPSR